MKTAGLIIALIALVLFAGTTWGVPAQGIAYGSQTTKDAPWYVMLAIIFAPGALAVLFTTATTIIVRRINRADGGQPFSAMKSVGWTLGAGVIWGPVWQIGLQRVINWLTGTPIFWELAMIAPFVTGIGSMIFYEFARWYTKTRYPGVYALIAVKHSSKAGHTGDTPPGDLTTIMTRPDGTPIDFSSEDTEPR